MVNGGTYSYEYHLKDHLGNTRVAYSDANSDGFIDEDEILQVNDYYPFGMRHEIEGYPNHANQKYLYNGKELQEETGWYDYGFRFYDPAIARWHVIDPLAEKRIEWSPYVYVLNNPILRIDPNGLTDFTFDKETGEVRQVGDDNNDPDRILKTDKNGNIKRKGEGLLGFMVSEAKRGEAKVAVGDIAKGILQDGQNFKADDIIVDVNGENQPTTEQVQDFVVNMSEYVGVEITGAYLSNEDADDAPISKIYIDEYIGNTETRSTFTPTRLAVDNNLRGMNTHTHFHTHPSFGYSASDRYRASDSDIRFRNNFQAFFRAFIILTKADGHPTRADEPFNYTNH